MAHWAEIDADNKVLRVVVTDNTLPDEGYQWLIDNLGGRWIKTSYNTYRREHLTGGTPLRAFYAGIGFTYNQEHDEFVPPSPFKSWIYDWNAMEWNAPIPMPNSVGLWEWDEEGQQWVR